LNRKIFLQNPATILITLVNLPCLLLANVHMELSAATLLLSTRSLANSQVRCTFAIHSNTSKKCMHCHFQDVKKSVDFLLVTFTPDISPVFVLFREALKLLPPACNVQASSAPSSDKATPSLSSKHLEKNYFCKLSNRECINGDYQTDLQNVLDRENYQLMFGNRWRLSPYFPRFTIGSS
jgi:hypothetical protein